MEKIFENQLIDIKNEDGNIQVDWKQECDNLAEEGYEPELKLINEIAQKANASKLLINLSGCEYFYTPENYQWIENLILSNFPSTEIDKIALVVPQNIFVNISFEATRASFGEKNRAVQYFKDKEKASIWLHE
jgi:hypothetical protein